MVSDCLKGDEIEEMQWSLSAEVSPCRVSALVIARIILIKLVRHNSLCRIVVRAHESWVLFKDLLLSRRAGRSCPFRYSTPVPKGL